MLRFIVDSHLGSEQEHLSLSQGLPRLPAEVRAFAVKWHFYAPKCSILLCDTDTIEESILCCTVYAWTAEVARELKGLSKSMSFALGTGWRSLQVARYHGQRKQCWQGRNEPEAQGCSRKEARVSFVCCCPRPAELHRDTLTAQGWRRR